MKDKQAHSGRSEAGVRQLSARKGKQAHSGRSEAGAATQPI